MQMDEASDQDRWYVPQWVRFRLPKALLVGLGPDLGLAECSEQNQGLELPQRKEERVQKLVLREY